ncbi:MAG: prepilin-type N-terminal cleavage/methylation domain-containing protein [Rhodoferax sp.]
MSKCHHRGFTLIEVVIFIVVVSAGLVGILAVSNTVAKSSADPMVRKQAVAIAESLLEEITLKEYANPAGGYAGTDRAQFDDVDDYAGYATTGIKDVSGSAVAGLERYNVAVAVATTADLPGVAAKRITVSVTVTGSNEAVTLIGYRSNY